MEVNDEQHTKAFNGSSKGDVDRSAWDYLDKTRVDVSMCNAPRIN